MNTPFFLTFVLFPGGKGGRGGDEDEDQVSASDIDLSDIDSKMESTINSLVSELNTFRVGRASPGISLPPSFL